MVKRAVLPHAAKEERGRAGRGVILCLKPLHK